MGTKIKVQKYFLKQQLTQALANVQKFEAAYKLLVERYNQLLGQARELNQTNNMQALLVASMIKDSPEQKLEVSHVTMNSFERSRIMIDAKGDDERGVQILTYESQPIPQEELDRMAEMKKQMDEAQASAREAQAQIDAASIPDCSDPDCKLPKELKHKHDAPVVEAPAEATLADSKTVEVVDVVDVPSNEQANQEVAVAEPAAADIVEGIAE